MSNSYDYVYYPRKSALDYKITKDGENKIHTLSWCIPRFTSIGKCEYIKAYETEYVDNIQEAQFRFKVKLCGINNDLLEIYYIFTKPVVLHRATFALLDTLFRNSHNINGSRVKETIIEIKNCTVVENKWQHLLTMNKLKVISYLTESENRIFKMEFNLTVSSEVSEHSELEPDEHQLSNALEWLLKSGMSSDVIMKSAEGFVFKVHKHILSSRSTVLKAHFAHNTLENKTNTVESHLDTDVLQEVLTYIYTDRAPRVQQLADKLLAAAEFYHLPGLKNISSEMLYMELTIDNAIDTLLLADFHNAKHLTKLTLRFIKDGHITLITKTDGWKSIKSVNVIKAICEVVTEVFEELKK